jgi:hypothetical protein
VINVESPHAARYDRSADRAPITLLGQYPVVVLWGHPVLGHLLAKNEPVILGSGPVFRHVVGLTPTERKDGADAAIF